jgi:hypothetical protein
MDRMTWADRALRVLGCHYRTNLITVVVPYIPEPGAPPPQNPDLALCVYGLGTTIGSGADLGSAIEAAIRKLTDDELLAAFGASGLKSFEREHPWPAHAHEPAELVDLTPLCPCGSGLTVARCRGRTLLGVVGNDDAAGAVVAAALAAHPHIGPRRRPDEGECRLCTRPAAVGSDFCERHAGGQPVPEDYKP